MLMIMAIFIAMALLWLIADNVRSSQDLRQNIAIFDELDSDVRRLRGDLIAVSSQRDQAKDRVKSLRDSISDFLRSRDDKKVIAAVREKLELGPGLPSPSETRGTLSEAEMSALMGVGKKES